MAGLELAGVERVTALLIGRLGDLIVSTPFLRALRGRFPRARIKLVTSAACEQAAALIPFVDEHDAVHRFHRAGSNLKTAARLALSPCDLLLDLNPSFSRSSAALAAIIRSPVKVGFKKGRLDGIFTHKAEAPAEREHMLDRYARLAALINAPYEPRLELKIPQEAQDEADKILARTLPGWSSKFRLLIHPGNFKKFDNRWPEDKFVQLTDRLLENKKLSVLYMAGPWEERPVSAIISRLKRPVPLLPPSPVAVTGALMRRMSLCVLNITGTTHLAAALGAPTFGFYAGYTDAVWRARGPNHSGVVSNSWTSCRDITVEQALAALSPLLPG